MDNGNGFPAASGFTGQASRSAEAEGEWTVGPTEALTVALRADQSEEEAPPQALMAEWALWGKDERNTGYHVMRCSQGHLTEAIFSGIITRYGSGVKPSLPQYTVCWIPGPTGGPEYLAVGIHEVIEPGSASAGGRSRNVGGRVVEYVRLFCFRYADVADYEASYAQLIAAVNDIPLVTGQGDADLIPVELPPEPEPVMPSGAWHQLAEAVAVTLLTGCPVCILDADSVPAAQRLAFIDLVLSLLPFGLRSRLSASTSASTTMQDLKLRLYFSNAPREDGGRTSHVSWSKPGSVGIAPGHTAARLYWDWLREAGPGAIAELTHATDPIGFVEADELQMLASLPNDKTIAETLEELSGKLRAADQPAVSAIVKRLRRYTASPQTPADRSLCRSLMLKKHHLFRDQPKIHGNVKSGMYRRLLALGFEKPLSYAAYCDIEDSIGGVPSWTLRKVLLEDFTANVLPYLLAGLARPGVSHVALRESLGGTARKAVELLDILDREMDTIRPRHRSALIDFTLQYLIGSARPEDPWQTAEDPRTALYERGFVTGLLDRAFPKGQAEQRGRLDLVLRYFYGDRLGPRQIQHIYAAPRLYPSPALDAAVREMASTWHRPHAEKQAAVARIRSAGHAEDVATILRPVSRSMLHSWRPQPGNGPHIRRLILAVITGLIITAILILALLLMARG